MKKKRKVLFSSMLIFYFMLILSNISLATENEFKLNIVQQSSGIKRLENNSGNISKKIVNSDLKNGEMTIQIELANVPQIQDNKNKYENTEIYIMITENLTKDEEKLQNYINYINTLATKVFAQNSKVKIGIIGIKGTINDRVENEDGTVSWGEKDEGYVKGSENNAELLVELTNEADKIKQGISNMNLAKTEYHENLQAAIRLANKSYSQESNKILISLYDDVPDIAIGVCSVMEYGGWLSEYKTMEEAVIGKHEKLSKYTRKEILELEKSSISFILLRPSDTSYDRTYYHISNGEKAIDFDGSPYVKEIYGTIEEPTYGKMYYFNDATLEKIITEDIGSDILNMVQPDINNIKIIDYFPEEITKNFDFEYVEKPNIGVVSPKIDLLNNTINWDIGKLDGNSTAILKYQLKIKSMQNQELLNKTMNTNEKLIVKYQDTDFKEYTVVLEDSPKIRLEKVIDGVKQDDKTNLTPNTNLLISNSNDFTTSPIMLPNTGITIKLIVAIISILSIAIIIYIKYRNLDEV